MQDCRLVVNVKDDVVSFEGEDISVEELATISGFLQVFVGTEGLKRGLSFDEVEDKLYDIWLASVETIAQLKQEGKLDAEGEEAD